MKSSKCKDQNYNAKFKVILRIARFAFLTVTLHFAFLTFNLSKSNAQEVSLSISPPLITIEANPPANIETPLTIENSSEDTAHLTIQIKPFTAASSSDGSVTYLKDDEKIQLPNPKLLEYMQIEVDGQLVNRFALSPKQQKKVTLHIPIPKGEQPGDYYFSVIFLSGKAEQKSDEELNGAYAYGGIAANVLLSIGPKRRTSADFEEFSTPYFVESGPVAFSVKVKNTSGHVLSPKGKILISNMFGQTIGKVDLLPVNILSGTSRYIPDAKQVLLVLKDQEKTDNISLPLEKPASLWQEWFLLGLYRARVELSLSESGPEIARETVFVGFPLRIVASLLVVASVVLLIRGRVRSRLGR